MVNMTGPCFKPATRITCRFNTQTSEGTVLGLNRAACIMPWTKAEGWIDFEISLNGGPYYWKGQFFVGNKSWSMQKRNIIVELTPLPTEPPNRSPELVWWDTEGTSNQKRYPQNEMYPETMTLRWDPYNITQSTNSKVTISLWGYLVRISSHDNLLLKRWVVLFTVLSPYFRKTGLAPS